MTKMVEQEILSSPTPMHTKITTIYSATVDEKDQKTIRKDLLQLKT